MFNDYSLLRERSLFPFWISLCLVACVGIVHHLSFQCVGCFLAKSVATRWEEESVNEWNVSNMPRVVSSRHSVQTQRYRYKWFRSNRRLLEVAQNIVARYVVKREQRTCHVTSSQNEWSTARDKGQTKHTRVQHGKWKCSTADIECFCSDTHNRVRSNTYDIYDIYAIRRTPCHINAVFQ